MAYTIHQIDEQTGQNGEMLGSGSVRYQVIRELIRLGFEPLNTDWKGFRLPRHGHMLIVCRPIGHPQKSYSVKAI